MLKKGREEDKLRLQYRRVVNDGGLCLTVMPTEQCNYRCVYCNEPFQKGAMSLEMQNALIGYLRKQLHSYNHLDIAWLGGEPLLAIHENA